MKKEPETSFPLILLLSEWKKMSYVSFFPFSKKKGEKKEDIIGLGPSRNK